MKSYKKKKPMSWEGRGSWFPSKRKSNNLVSTRLGLEMGMKAMPGVAIVF